MKIPIVVTDHAVLRYLERAHGLDVEFFRRHIAALATNGAALGATGVRIEGVNLILRGATVVTVLESRMHALPPPGGNR